MYIYIVIKGIKYEIGNKKKVIHIFIRLVKEKL